MDEARIYKNQNLLLPDAKRMANESSFSHNYREENTEADSLANRSPSTFDRVCVLYSDLVCPLSQDGILHA